MRRLRAQRDLIGLIAVWGLLLQSLAVPFSSGLHAAALAAVDADFALICTRLGPLSSTVPGLAPEGRKQNRKGADCPGSMACHAGCGGFFGELPAFARVMLPGEGRVAAAGRPHARPALEDLRGRNHARAPPSQFFFTMQAPPSRLRSAQIFLASARLPAPICTI